jgi:hypothetical protein
MEARTNALNVRPLDVLQRRARGHDSKTPWRCCGYLHIDHTAAASSQADYA